MNYEDFVCFVQSGVSDKLGEEVHAQLHQITKNNGIVLDGLSIQEEGYNVAPTVYLNDMYKEYQRGMSLAEIIEHIVAIYKNSRLKPGFDEAFYTDFQKVRDNLACKLIHKGRNEQMLKKVPHKDFLDLAIVVYYRVCDTELGSGSILVYESHRKMWGISEEELFRIARNNMKTILPEKFVCIETILEDEIKYREEEKESQDKEFPMYVLTNDKCSYGAATMIYDSVLAKIGVKLRGDFWLLPSSVHELIIIPKSSGAQAEDLRTMVCQINATEVAPEDVLSNEIYEYNLELHKLQIA